MDLFAAAGINLGDGGRGGRPGRSGAVRTLRVPLLNYKVLADAFRRVNFEPTKEQLEAAKKYAEAARSPRFRANETRIRNRFYDEILGTLLGYRKYDPDHTYTVDFEHSTRGGSADVALGHFSEFDGKNEVVAPFEMKGPLTTDLDALPPGGRRSPVQQAWEYAIDTPGARWVLVSNCCEIRLYAFGRGRDAYELFDLTKLDDRSEHEKLWLILSTLFPGSFGHQSPGIMTGAGGASLGWDRRRRVTPAGHLPAHDLAGLCVRLRPRKPGLKLSLRDDDSLWRELWWNADRRACSA
jgi:hypothetical protein